MQVKRFKNVGGSTGASRRWLLRSQMKGGSRARQRARRLRSIQMSLRILTLLAIAAALIFASELFIPLVLAAFIALGLNPIVQTLRRFHVPRPVGSALLMLALGAVIGVGVAELSGPATEWVHQAPDLIHKISHKADQITQPLQKISNATSNSLASVGVSKQPTAKATAPTGFSFSTIVNTAPRILVEVLTVALLVFFFLSYGRNVSAHLISAMPAFRYRRLTLRLIQRIQHQFSRYLLTVTIINICLGLLTAGILWLLGVPDPLLWGSLATLLNYMPYVGAFITTLMLLGVGFLHFDELLHSVLPAACFVGVSLMEGNVITPMVMGARMRISPLAILVWLLIWGWMWGIPGALLAVPILTCLKVITEQLPGWQWFAQMIDG